MALQQRLLQSAAIGVSLKPQSELLQCSAKWRSETGVLTINLYRIIMAEQCSTIETRRPL